MAVVPEKIRSGLVELRTKSGPVYVNPSFSERLYLLWTFRNFHRLPVEVLNRHQREMIERLGQTAVLARQGPVPRSVLIGSVENVEVALVSRAKAAVAEETKVVKMSAPLTFMGKAAGSEAVRTEPRRLKPPRHVIHFPGKSRGAPAISAPEPDSKGQVQSPKGRARRFPQILMYRGSGKSLGVGLFAACCLALLVFYHRAERSVSSRSVPQPAREALNPSPISSLSTYITEPEKVPSPIATPPAKVARTIAVDSVSSQPPAETRPSAEVKQSTVSLPPPGTTAPLESVHRPHISEWPERGFSYPIAPSPDLTGTVLLKAVIGVNGTVTSVDILSGNQLLASAASEAVWHWRYPPHKVNGMPTEAETSIVIDFRGDDAVSISFPAM